MAEIDDVLAAAVRTVTQAVPELNGYSYVVTSMKFPAVVAYPPDSLTYSESMGGDATVLFVLRLYVPRTQDGSDQAKLNGYISRSGPTSVFAALDDDPTLGGVVADAMPVEATNYGNWPLSQVTYTGVEIRVRAMLA